MQLLSDSELNHVYAERVRPQLFGAGRPSANPRLVIVGGQPGAGKTLATLNAVRELGRAGDAVAYIGALLYLGLLRIPLRWFFSVTAVLVLLLAASMASQVARSLVQADIIPSLGAPVWDSSSLLSQSSPMGTLLHGLVGYDARPAGVQLVFYLVALLVIGCAMVWVGRH